MVYRKHILTIIVTVCISIGCVVTATADGSEHEEWMPVMPKPLGSESVKLPYEWNENDDMAAQVRGLVHNLFMDEEDSQIKLMATDYAMVMTSIRRPQGILDDGSVLIGVYYSEFDDNILDKISVVGEYPAELRYLSDNQTALIISPDEPLDEAAFLRNFDSLKILCGINTE